MRAYVKAIWHGIKKSYGRKRRKGSKKTKFWEDSLQDSLDDITKEELEKFKYVFESFDKNKNKLLDLEELAALMDSFQINLSSTMIQTLLHAVDDDNSGTLSLNEFIHLADVDFPLDSVQSVDVDKARLKLWKRITGSVPGSDTKKNDAKGEDSKLVEIMI